MLHAANLINFRPSAYNIHSHDPRTAETEREVQKIIDLQSLANQLPDHFSDLKTVTKLHVHAHNAPERVQILKKNDGIPAPVQRPKRTRNPASPIPSTWGRMTKKDKRDLLQPVAKVTQSERGASRDLAQVRKIQCMKFRT